ncbi:MAG: traD [Candidatus Midichloriaceae bacterium]|jgi:type IV conjugative transfer system coupling protein TraD|nr:traD [Candidatus Midichloriaceae bacterium]
MFIRGGQLSLHALRMFRQVLIALLKWGGLFFVLMTLLLCVMKISLYEMKLAYFYALAQMFVELGQKEHLFLISGINGIGYTISAINLLTNAHIAAVQKGLEAKFWASAKTSSHISAVLFTLITIIFLWKGKKFSQDEDIRGSTLIQPEKLKKLIKHDNKKLKYDSYLLADIPYPAHSENTHTLIAGSTGSGKTILISSLIAQIKERGDRAIIFDKMGTYTERFFDPKLDTLLNPFDKRSPNWSIFKEVSQEANFDAIAAALIPFERAGADPFWTKAARTIFSEVCTSLFKKGGVSNADLVNTLLKKDLEEAAKLVKGTAAQAIIDEKSPKTALSVMAVLSTYLKCLKFLRDEGNFFSIKDWVKNEEENGCVFIPSNGDLHSTLMPLISAWLEIAINNILSLSKSRERKIWIIIDELPSLHTLPTLEQGLAEVRQFGGCVVLSIQSISQLRDRYGANGSQTISSLCNNKVFLRAGDYDSAKWYSDNIGTAEIEEYREGLSYGAHEMRDGISINRHKHNKYLALPSELINLKDKEGYFCMAKGYGVTKVAFEYKNWDVLNEKFEGIEFLTAIEEGSSIEEKEQIIVAKPSLFEA